MKKLLNLQCKEHSLSFEKTVLMGILNITPDSFSDGGRFTDVDSAVAHAKQMIADGAQIIDIGGESSRPGSAPLSEQEELERVLPVVRRLLDEVSVPLSIDTYKPTIAERCLQQGVHLLNDITGLTNPALVKVAARYNVPVVVMHMKGTPKTMQQNPIYQDVIGELKTFFKQQLTIAHDAGIKQVVIDPGIGFGKTAQHNLEILKHLESFKSLRCPVLVGPSRKSFIGMITGKPVNERLEGTIAAVCVAVMNGANIIRIHDVKECKQAVQILDAIRGV
jgi:dihydropteroate synthase